MIRRSVSLLLFLGLLCGLLLTLIAPAVPSFAADSKGGISITPPFQEITILPNQTSVPSSFAVANNTTSPTNFQLSAIDMGTLDDTGGVVFSGLPEDYEQKYGLAKWLQLSSSNVTIPPKSTQQIKFTVINDPAMGPGGHYGAIVVKSEQTSERGKNQVGLQPQAAELLFARKVGGERYDLKLEAAAQKTFWWHLPNQIELKFRNNGNIHVVPRGIVTLQGPDGHEVARGIINPASSLILPERSRIYNIYLTFSQKIRRPGQYTAEINYRYDGTQTLQKGTQHLRFVNLPLIVVVFIVLMVAGVLLRFLLKIGYKKDDSSQNYTVMSLGRIDRQHKRSVKKKARKK
jgi:hypothetical protein